MPTVSFLVSQYNNMRIFLVVLLALVGYVSSQCEQEGNCVASAGCRCPSDESPLPVENTPQFVVISFNDAVSALYTEQYYLPLFEGRNNPDNNPASATFFVPHEYTDYSMVNRLYNLGHEIAVHTITKTPMIDYWKEASLQTLIDEFQGQKQIINAFANIPEAAIVGARVPNFELVGDDLFTAYSTAGLEYDATWTLLSTDLIFPFSLHANDGLQCVIGTSPEENHAGQWVSPVINLVGDEVECNNLQACRLTGEAAEIEAWFTQQFNSRYNENRAPLYIIASAAWFMTTPDGYSGLTAFLDTLKAKNDVFIVSNDKVIEWAKNPVPAANFNSASSPRSAECGSPPTTCAIPKGEDETRYMVVCTSCPAVFPWLGNPLGLAE